MVRANKRKRPGLSCLQAAILFFLALFACILSLVAIGLLGVLAGNAGPFVGMKREAMTVPASTPTTIGAAAAVLPGGVPVTAMATNPVPASMTAASRIPVATMTLAPTPLPDVQIVARNVFAGDLAVHFVDVGEGDATLLMASDGANVLIDGGSRDSGILNYLQTVGVDRLDLVFATHPDEDHIGGLVSVLKEIPVGRVVTNGEVGNTGIYADFVDAMASVGVQEIKAKRGDKITAGQLEFNVLNPSAELTDDNNSSLVLRLQVAGTGLLFEGDAQAEAEASMLAAGLDVTADILKVAHHGSDSSSSAEFLKQVQPKLAVYSAGKGNPFNHPHPEVIARLENAGAVVMGTDQKSTVIVRMDATGFYTDSGSNPGRASSALQIGMTPAPIGPAHPAPPPSQNGVTPAAPGSAPTFFDNLQEPGTVKRGHQATIAFRTNPGAKCSIQVMLKSGPSQADGLEPVKADDSGMVSWTWTVGSNTVPGKYRIVVFVNGQAYPGDIWLTVTK